MILRDTRFKRIWMSLVLLGIFVIMVLIYKTTRSSPYNQVRVSINVNKFNGVWQVVNTSVEMYLFSAFYDDRPSLLTDPVIRVIGISEIQVEKMKIYCYAWFASSKTIFVGFADVMVTSNGKHHQNKLYREHIYTCGLHNTTAIPKAVSIELAVKGQQPLFQSTYLHVQIPEKPKAKRDFINCVKATYGKVDPYRVVEWMELQKIWGVDKVAIYNSGIEDESLKVFLHYQSEGFVDFIEAPLFVSDTGQLHLKQLMGTPTLGDCLYRNIYMYNKIIVTDLDEMIVPRTTLNYKSLLAEIDKQQPSEHEARSYMFRNAYFFTDPEITEDKNMPENLLTLRHRVRLPPSPPRHWVKSIMDPQACLSMHNHVCSFRAKKYDTQGHNVEVNIDLGLNQHYKKCTNDNTIARDSREKCGKLFKERIGDDTMLRFKDELVSKVSRQLKLLGLEK